MSDFTDIRYEVQDPYAVITLNRPDQLNAFTYHTLGELRAAFTAAEADSAVVGIIITGAGRAFSAGLDMSTLTETTQSSEAPRTARQDELPGLFSYLLEIPKPIIAAINGVTAGGGLILALMSDLRFASVDAALTTVFLKRGLVAEHGSSWLLPRLVGVSKALDLLWMSDKITADEALAIGLVDRVIADDRLLETAKDYVGRLSTTTAPKAIGATKKLVYDHLGLGYEAALRDAESVQNQFVTAPDAVEGAKSFVERRPPEFERIGK